ncbi:MAG: sugar ABC transporter substrate-binding protein [Chloroflexota bacterium]
MRRHCSLLLLLFFFIAACTPQAVRPTRTPYQTDTPSPVPTKTLPPTTTPTPRSLDATVSIWHSWNEGQVVALDQILRAFQGAYPNVRFDVRYIPAEDLQARYHQAAYNGSGPTILLGQAAWGEAYARQHLVADLTPFVHNSLRQSLMPPAVNLGFSRGQWIGLPYAVSGVVLYRNPSIVPQAAANFAGLIDASLAVTKGGVVGADLERGPLYSGAHLYGLGGSLMDDNCNPTFNTDSGLLWVDLLRDFQLAGPVELNTNRDLRLFKEATAGMIVEGTWKRVELSQAVGWRNIVIDPWPDTAAGKLSGFVWAESLYLNINAVGDEQAAATRLMTYFLTHEVQTLLAEVGFIPSVTAAQPRDALIQQAATALAGGTAYPLCPEQGVYWDALTSALYAIFTENADPATALQQAALAIETRLIEIRTSP